MDSCDPCSFNIQDVTIANLRHRTALPSFHVELSPRLDFEHFNPAGEYDVLPLYNSQHIEKRLKEYLTVSKEILTNYLTAAKNPFLSLRWQRFCTKPPNKVLRLEVMKYKKEPNPPVRRMILNGEPRAKNGLECYPVPADPSARGFIKSKGVTKKQPGPTSNGGDEMKGSDTIRDNLGCK